MNELTHSIRIEIIFDLSKESDVSKWTDKLQEIGFNRDSLVIELPIVKIKGKFNGNLQNILDFINSNIKF